MTPLGGAWRLLIVGLPGNSCCAAGAPDRAGTRAWRQRINR